MLAWGAINALRTDSGVPQVRFKWDYAGGWGKYRNGKYWQTFRNACRPYDGPPLVYVVAACKAPDGTYWAVQAWQRRLPLRGIAPWLAAQSAYEFDVSHWSGELASSTVPRTGRTGSGDGIFGRLTYAGKPVHGFGDAVWQPARPLRPQRLHRHLNSAYGPRLGSRVRHPAAPRERDVLPQLRAAAAVSPTIPISRFAPRPGRTFRVTVMGPGVTPIVQWEGAGLEGGRGRPSSKRCRRTRARSGKS